MMGYTVKFLSDVEFNSLPYKHVQESLGCADPKTKTAYVRRTGIKPLDQFVTEHELDELIAKVSPHEEDGIRYKKGRDIFGTIAPIAAAFIPGIGPALSAAMSAGYTGYKVSKKESQPWQIPVNALLAYGGGKLAQGSTEYSDAVEASRKAGGGMIGQTLSGIQGALGMQSGAQASQKLMQEGSALGSKAAAASIKAVNAATNAASPGMGAAFAPLAATASTALPAGMGAGTVANTLGFTPSVNSVAAMPGGTAQPTGIVAQPTNMPRTGGNAPSPVPAAPAAGTAQPAAKGILGKASDLLGMGPGDLLRMGLGAGASMLGQGLAPKVEPFSPYGSELFNQTVERVKAGTQVQLTGEQRQAITQAYDDELEDAREELYARYRGMRPGSDLSNDSELAQAVKDLETDYAAKKANAVISAQFQLTREQTVMMSELAAMDVYSLAYASGVSLQEAAQFKQMMADLGYMVATGGKKQQGGMANILSQIYNQ